MPRPFSSLQTARDYLADRVGRADDPGIDIFAASIALAAVHRPDSDVAGYFDHLDAMADRLTVIHNAQCAARNGDTAAVRVESLGICMAQEFGYIGDDKDYDNLQNADMMRTVDRRMGLPITLCIIGIALSRRMGWACDGLNFPGHFLMRLDHDGERLIYDPFQGGRTLQAADLRALLKKTAGPGAELSNTYYEPCTNRDILLRLQNNIKFRLIDAGHYLEALEIVELMGLIAPGDPRLLLDMAVLLARLERPKAAIETLERYIDAAHGDDDRAEAMAMMRQLQALLN